MSHPESPSHSQQVADSAPARERLWQAASMLFDADDTRPTWVWNAQGDALVWANAAGLEALELDAKALANAVPTAPAMRSLQGVARTQVGASSRGRIEILRISTGSQQETLVATCKPVMLGDSVAVLALGNASSARRAPIAPSVIAPSVPVMDAPAEPPQEAFALAIDAPSFEAGTPVEEAPAIETLAAATALSGFAFKSRSRPHRFSFKVDSSGKIFDLSSGLSDAIGAASALQDGELASEALASRIDDLPPSVFHGIDERHRFSEHEVLWPVSGTNLDVPVRLSGFDEDDDTLRVFGTALTGKAMERAIVSAHEAPSATEPTLLESRHVEALDVDPMSGAAAETAGLFSSEPAPTDEPNPEAMDVSTVAVAPQVPGGAALAAAASAMVAGVSAGLTRALPAQTEATPAEPVIALDDALETEEAEVAGLWSPTPAGNVEHSDLADAPADVFAAPILTPISSENVGDDVEPGSSAEPDLAAEPDFPAETVNAMKAVAAGVAAGLAGGVAGGVARGTQDQDTPNEEATQNTSDEVAITSEAAPAPTTPSAPGSSTPDLAAPTDLSDADLSRPERLTFQEIARRLGARITGRDDGSDNDPSARDADVVQLSTSSPDQDGADDDTTSTDAAMITGVLGAGALGAAGLLSGNDDQESDDISRDDNSAQVLPFSRTQPNAERMVLDRLPLGIIIYSEEAILYGNRAALDMAGLSNLEALKALSGIEGLFADGMEEGHGAMTLVKTDGTKLPVTGRLQSVRWEAQSAALLSLREHTDIDTANQEASQDASMLAAGAALASEDGELGANSVNGALPLVRERIGELEAIIDLASDGVVTLDGEGEIKDLNQAAQALVGYAADDLIGRPFRLLFPEDSRQTALDYLDDIAGQGRLSLFNEGRELECITSQGGLVPVFMTLGRLTDDEPATYCAVLRDLSPFKQAESDLVDARKAAEEASAHKSEFLARVSHEIRTPLNAVIGFSEVMLEERFGPVGSERYRQYLRDIHTSGEHLMSLLNDLLDLSKIEAGKMDLSFGEVDLNDVVQQCLAIMQPQANQGRIIVRTSLPLSLPKVVADIRSIRQVVLNLMSNAIKFTDAGGQIIVSTLYEPSGEVSLRVRDTGRGMDAADVELAMEPFRQVPTTLNQVITGTGLGLPLTKALVEANRAQFGLESTPGEGTLAMMTFPSQRVLAE
ncbi:MAG: histidine kinase dimerization/phospho-acceptor domain-containing protein [Devosiaceae bacterium]